MCPEVVADYACHTGECPHWHSGREAVYWEDIPTGRLYHYDPASETHQCCFDGTPLRGFTIEDDGGFLLFFQNGEIRYWTDDRSTVVCEPDSTGALPFNDVVADPAGRVFCGVMATDDRPGQLYRLNLDGSLSIVSSGYALPNGMGFSPDRDALYFTDSHDDTIYVFSYDEETGGLSDRRVFVTTDDDEGAPDGLTVDAEGHVWSARWDGGRIVRYTPEGEKEQEIEFPAKKVTSLTFGGADCTDIYVTTARGPASDPPGAKGEEGDGAGALFRVTQNVAGKPDFRSRIDY